MKPKNVKHSRKPDEETEEETEEATEEEEPAPASAPAPAPAPASDLPVRKRRKKCGACGALGKVRMDGVCRECGARRVVTWTLPTQGGGKAPVHATVEEPAAESPPDTYWLDDLDRLK